MRTWLKSCLVAMGLMAIWALLPPGAFATIVGSVHDFSGSPFSGGQICIVCHAPHNTATGEEPLWNHALTTATFTLYSSSTLDATMGQPQGVSKLCLSCHDGTVAIDSFGGATGTSFIPGPANLGIDLSNDHPISFEYDPVAAADAEINPRSGVDPNLLFFTNAALTNSLECGTCHDVHNVEVVGGIGGDPLLRASKLSSAICLECHAK